MTGFRVFHGVPEVATAEFQREPNPGTRYIAGVDWPVGDALSIAIFDHEAKNMVALYSFSKAGWHGNRNQLLGVFEIWQPIVIWTELNAMGAVNLEALQAEGLPIRGFKATSRSSVLLIEMLARAIEGQRLTILPDEDLLNELRKCRCVVDGVGKQYSYQQVDRSPNTRLMATCLAWYGVTQTGVRVEFV